MSVFGYGQSYTPQSQQQTGVQQNPQMSPSYSSANPGRGGGGPGSPIPGVLPPNQPGGFPGMQVGNGPMAPVTTAPGINFMPEANEPWKTTYSPIWGEKIDKSRSFMRGFSGAPAAYERRVMGQQMNPFRNVLDTFNGKKSLLGLQVGKSPTDVANANPNVGWRGDAYQTGVDRFGNPIYGSAPAQVGGVVPTEVHSFRDLSSQIAGLNDEQLMFNDASGKYVQMFQGAANNLANAWANTDYAGLHSPLGESQQQAADWLQAAYNQMIQRLNAAYLL